MTKIIHNCHRNNTPGSNLQVFRTSVWWYAQGRASTSSPVIRWQFPHGFSSKLTALQKKNKLFIWRLVLLKNPWPFSWLVKQIIYHWIPSLSQPLEIFVFFRQTLPHRTGLPLGLPPKENSLTRQQLLWREEKFGFFFRWKKPRKWTIWPPDFRDHF